MKKTIIDLFENSVKQYPDNPFLWEKTRDAFEPTTYKEVQQQVYAAGAGLIALGVKKGDNMALLSEGRNAWIIGELAMFYAGATNVPLSIKLEEANDLLFRLVHADVKYILVSGNQLKKIRAIMDKLPLVEKIIVIDELPEYKEKEISWSEVFRMAKNIWHLILWKTSLLLDNPYRITTMRRLPIPQARRPTQKVYQNILTHRNYTANVSKPYLVSISTIHGAH